MRFGDRHEGREGRGTGAVGAVLTNPQHPYTRQLIESVPRPGWKPRRRGGRVIDPPRSSTVQEGPARVS
ncbi:hypothetical protein [Branchiibius cervicis]|uniref:Oligopeptide/dipeptide ABC transporter C-terminal domain-containing protein n=1 Tax=Branchiibius cervicis TaxID=908252 RepID=A0ABW2ASP1_9MICO